MTFADTLHQLPISASPISKSLGTPSASSMASMRALPSCSEARPGMWDPLRCRRVDSASLTSLDVKNEHYMAGNMENVCL